MNEPPLFRLGCDAARPFLAEQNHDERGYICPLCLEIITEAGRLTREHVPPKALGGDVLCLTCKGCNNTAGYSVDAAMAERALVERIMLQGPGGQFIQLEVDGTRVNARAVRRGDFIDYEMLEQYSSPAKYQEILQKFKTPREGSKLRVWFNRQHSDREALVGDLRTSYLMLFAKFGYSFILDAALDPVREQIQNPKLPVIEQWWLERREQLEKRSILLVTEPIRCFVVNIDHRAVVVPVNIDSYRELSELLVKKDADDCVGVFHYSAQWDVPASMELLWDS